jgi:hypothetical protein
MKGTILKGLNATAISAAVAGFAGLSDEDRVKKGAEAIGLIGGLFADIKALGKQSKVLKDRANDFTIKAHAANIAALVFLDLKDEKYGSPDYRNTTTGPAYVSKLKEAGVSEAKAKLFWEYGQLALKEPVVEGENGADFTGLNDVAKAGPGAVVQFFAKQGIETEAGLKKIVQPTKTSIAAMVHKLTAKLSDDELEMTMLEVAELRAKAAEEAAKKAAAEAIAQKVAA